MPRPLNAEEEEPNTEVPQGEMPRALDPLPVVEVLPNNKRKCNFCGNEYVGDTKRIKAQFAGVGGCGILGCKVFNDRVRSEAPEVLKGERAVESSKRQGNDEGSSNLTQSSHQPLTAGSEVARCKTSFVAMPYLSYGAGSSTFLPWAETNFPNQSVAALTNIPRPLNAKEGELNTEVPHGARPHLGLVKSQRGTRGLADANMMSLKRKLEELISSRQADMNELKSKWTRTEEEYWSVVRAIREGITFPPEKVAEVEGLCKEVEQILLVPGRFRQEATVRCCKTSPSVTIEELVGKETLQKVDEIVSFIMLSKDFVIGVYGMGGVGKTAILRNVYNRLLEYLALDVFWVAVPQDFSVYALQEAIANAVGLDNLSNEKDVKRRAGLLCGHLKVKKRPVLILDGLWRHFEVKDVGISVGMGRLGLVVTTQSLDVCRMMLCQKQMKIELLNKEDSWRLFSRTLCFAVEQSQEVEQIARSLLDRCYGLPLGIIEIATRMRGIEKEEHAWRWMLQNLEDLTMELDVFKRLQLSYLNLGNEQVQQCFLHFILCFGNYLSADDRKCCIESFIDEGLLGGIATRIRLYERGNEILGKIEGAGLLDFEKGHWCLHPLTRDMALHMVPSTTHMFKANMGLREIPEDVFWTDRLEKVFLHGNEIEEIPYGVSPNCPKLTRLSLHSNISLGVIHGSFFRHLKGLTVLDLSWTGITELPDSISELESLEALLLQGCSSLRFIPYVGKLRSLRKLDLSDCESLGEVPEGMEMLANLRYLALDGSEIHTLPEGVLGKLVNLQYLVIKELRVGEEVKLPEVEELYCSVSDVEMFNACVGCLERNGSPCYRLVMGAPSNSVLWCGSETERSLLIDSCDHIAVSVDGTSGDGCALLPESVQSLELSRCHKMKRVMEREWLTAHLPNLEEIIIISCENLEEIIHGPLPSEATCRLKYLEVNGCNNMKRVLLTQDMVLHLPFLEEIVVKGSKGIELIMGTVAKMTYFSFPKLMKLVLCNLPELKSICDGITRCNSLQWVSIYNCPKLKRIPLQLPLLDNGLPSPPPSLREIQINRQMWELLEWDHPLARSSLEHFIKFLD
ncbi:probable disease resistance protein At4g27220 isoform X2 [Eucalyptus grandis]|uniref:probable disease resistance protein At4g27220 isoform X2 n=1 Tax=Eucalyptus grandis TaxID=71139 RepID=UPI00192EEFC1|nr:probable disease resistance protein At4g27220 isoform X2 [Eucalyptus grandis]